MKRWIVIFITLISFILLLSPICLAEDRYILIGQNENEKVYIDKLTIYHKSSSDKISDDPINIYYDKGTIDVWVKCEYTEKGKQSVFKVINKSEVSYSLAHWIFKTDANEIKTISKVFYDENGNVIYQYDVPLYEQKFETIVPESAGEVVRKSAMDYMYQFYKDTEKLRQDFNDPNNPMKESLYLLTQDTEIDNCKWLFSNDKVNLYYIPKSVKWIQHAPSKIVEVVFKETYSQKGLEELITRHSIFQKDLSGVSYTLRHVQINLTENKRLLMSGADFDAGGKMLVKLVIPYDKRTWSKANTDEIYELNKRLN